MKLDYTLTNVFLDKSVANGIVGMFVTVTLIFLLLLGISAIFKSPKLQKFINVKNYLTFLFVTISISIFGNYDKIKRQLESTWNEDEVKEFKHFILSDPNTKGIPFPESINSRVTLNNWLKKDKMLSIKKGNQRLFSRRYIERYKQVNFTYNERLPVHPDKYL